MQNIGTVLVVVLVVALAIWLLGGVGMMGFGMGGMMGGYGGYGMHGFGNQYGFGFNPIGAILSLVFWALPIGGIVLLVVWLARNAGRASGGAPSRESPLDILKARYAKGEITKEQFDAIRRDLEA
jgi:putative membrane protein